MIFVIVENGVVKNRIDAPDQVTADSVAGGALAINDSIAQIGWSYDGMVFTPPPAAPVVPQPVVPKPLTKLEFIRLCRSAGGSTPDMIVAAKKDVLLEYMWMEFEMAHGVEKDDPSTAEGLGALETLGYLPNGAQAVLDAWPSA